MSKGWFLGSGLALGFILGVANVKLIKRAWFHHIDEVSCSHFKVVKVSPDGAIRATLTTEGCDYGFGLAERIAKLRIEKPSAEGWRWDKLLYDSPDSDIAPKVTLTWLGRNVLETEVETSSFSGSYAQYLPGITLVQTYRAPATVNPPSQRPAR